MEIAPIRAAMQTLTGILFDDLSVAQLNNWLWCVQWFGSQLEQELESRQLNEELEIAAESQ